MNKNTKIGVIIAIIAVSMIGLSFAFVPLYSMICKVTGMGGVVDQGSEIGIVKINKKIKIRFDSNIDSKLQWKFKPLQKEVEINIGEKKLAFYYAKNLTNKPITGIATYNVTPEKVAQYFTKIECFCFVEQTLAPYQEVDMPVSFFVDPKIVEDKNAQDVETITLSYTFFNRDK